MIGKYMVAPARNNLNTDNLYRVSNRSSQLFGFSEPSFTRTAIGLLLLRTMLLSPS